MVLGSLLCVSYKANGGCFLARTFLVHSRMTHVALVVSKMVGSTFVNGAVSPPKVVELAAAV